MDFRDRVLPKSVFPGTSACILWLPSIPRFRCSQSDPALRLVLGVAMTVHSGICGPVHTGIVSDIKLFGARRLQRRLEPCSTTSATGPSRCVPPPCGHHRTAQVWVSTAGLGSSRLPLRPGLLRLRFLGEYDFWGCPADAGRRLTAGRRRQSPRGTLSLWRFS